MKPDEKKELRHAHGQAAVISFLLVSIGFLYAFLVEYLRRTQFSGLMPELSMPALRLVVVGTILALFIYSRYLSNKILFGPPLPTDPLQTLSPEEKRRRLYVSTLVSYAFFESFMAISLVLYILTGLPQDFYAIFAATLALSLIHFPRFDTWTRLYDEMDQRIADSGA
jgi:hypothetical protein